MRFVTTIDSWTVTLVEGQVLEIWASAYSQQDDAFVFDALVDADEEEQGWLDVIGRTPANPERVMIALARIPVEIVEKIRTTGAVLD